MVARSARPSNSWSMTRRDFNPRRVSTDPAERDASAPGVEAYSSRDPPRVLASVAASADATPQQQEQFRQAELMVAFFSSSGGRHLMYDRISCAAAPKIREMRTPASERRKRELMPRVFALDVDF